MNNSGILRSILPQLGWYPDDAAELKETLQGLLGPQRPDPKMTGIIAPHAGYAYCGATAAAAFRLLDPHTIRHVIAIGPSHHYHLANQVSLLDYTALRTPLGDLMINQDYTQALLTAPSAISAPEVHANEHSNQILAPFIQYLLPEATFTSMIIGQLDTGDSIALAKHIRPLLQPDTLLLISSDFTHYGPRFDYTPFHDNIPDQIKAIDMAALAYIYHLDADGFRHFIETTPTTICGRFAIELMLRALDGPHRVQDLDYHRSAEDNDDWTHSVSYLSMAISKGP